MEWGQRYAKVYSVVLDGRLDGVGFEDRVLIAPSQWVVP